MYECLETAATIKNYKLPPAAAAPDGGGAAAAAAAATCYSSI